MFPQPPRSTLFPYTTLFRSGGEPVRLTNDTAEEADLIYAPDGETIYFTRIDNDGSAIWRIGVLGGQIAERSEEHTSELQSLTNLVCRLLLEKKKKKN